MRLWQRFLGRFAGSAPSQDGVAHQPRDGVFMTLDALIEEGRRLQRECVFLVADGSGDPAATWHRRPGRSSDVGGFEPWLSVDTRFIPGFDVSKARFLTICTSGDCESGRIDAVASLPPGMPLYARPVALLPPIEAVFALGGDEVGTWLAANGWGRGDRFNKAFADRALVEAYERVWAAEHPILGQHPGLHAALGGWHLPGADDDWFDLLHERLLAVTVEGSEPWVEAWEAVDGRLHVVQRVT